MHPRSHLGKTYRVTVRPGITEEQVIALSTGIELDGRMTLPATVRVLTQEPGRAVIEMVLREGRNRQIRRMCEALGLKLPGCAGRRSVPSGWGCSGRANGGR